MVNVDVIKISEKEGVFTLYTENQILYEFLFGSTGNLIFEIKNEKFFKIETLLNINKNIKDRLFYGRRTKMIHFNSTQTINLFSESPEFLIYGFSKSITPFKGDIFSDHNEDTYGVSVQF